MHPCTIRLSYNTDKISSDGRVMVKPYFTAVCKQQPGGVTPDLDDPNNCDFLPRQGTCCSSQLQEKCWRAAICEVEMPPQNVGAPPL